MAFPTSSLTNNQVHKEGNRAFVYDSALGVWDQVRETDRTENKILQGEIGSDVTGYAGIKEIDQWRLTTQIAGGSLSQETTIAANLERIDNTGQNKLGTGMTESSGVFTFPSTGIWHVQAEFYWVVSGDNSASRYNTGYIKNNSDASNYLASCPASINPRSTSAYSQSAICQTVLDITDTTANAQKIIFRAVCALTSANLLGSSVENQTCFTFIRIGDT